MSDDRMTAKAKATGNYDAFIAAGWTDAQLIQHPRSRQSRNARWQRTNVTA
jgi:hypothetical protein